MGEVVQPVKDLNGWGACDYAPRAPTAALSARVWQLKGHPLWGKKRQR
jgi:hypothetical protein